MTEYLTIIGRHMSTPPGRIMGKPSAPSINRASWIPSHLGSCYFLELRLLDLPAIAKSSSTVEIALGISRHRPPPDLPFSIKFSALREVCLALHFGPPIALISCAAHVARGSKTREWAHALFARHFCTSVGCIDELRQSSSARRIAHAARNVANK
jgi:hypothetical protein